MEGDIWDYDGVTQMYNWGYAPNGQIGRNNTNSLSSPALLPGTGWMRSYGTTPSTNKITGDIPQLAIKSDGTLWAWGWNDGGNLGLNNTTKYSSPTQVGANTNWKGITLSVCNDVSTSAWKTDGSLWTWGYNNQGQLGHNDKTNYSSPRQVGTDTDWNKIHGAHSDQVYVEKTDGTLWTWGRNHYGQLGHNNTTDYSSPKQVSGTWSGSGFSVSYHVTIACKSNGTLWSWGYQGYGELGQNQGPSAKYSSPNQIGSATDWDPDGISGGGFQSMGCTKTNGELYMWGRNLGGVLGINIEGNDKSRSSPTQIPGTWSSIRIAGRTSYGTQTL